MSLKIKIVFLMVLMLIIINSNNVMANYDLLTYNEFEQIIDKARKNNEFTTNDIQELVDIINSYQYVSIYKGQTGALRVLSSNTAQLINSNNTIWARDTYSMYLYDSMDESRFYKENSAGLPLQTPTILYFSANIYNSITGDDYTSSGVLKYTAGYKYPEDLFETESRYKKPYFEWAVNQIGTTNIENFDENLPCFYPSSFKTNTNSYAKFKKIGTLYISEDYGISNIYTNTPIINVYNMSQTQQWSYENYLIFTDKTVVDGMIAYNINIDTNYINTPYIYSIPLISQDKELADDIYINFVLLTKTTEGSGIIVDSGDTQLSGDFEKDETTLGDINNTINNIGNKIENKVEDIILGTENESGDREGGLLGGLLDGIKGLFVPSEADMSEWLTRTQAEISKQLGILGEPINFFSTLMNKLLIGNGEEFIFHIPDLIIPGTNYKLLDAFDINFTQMINEHEAFKTIYDGYIVIISGIMVYCFYSYLWSFYDHILGTRDVESAYKIVEQENERQQIIQKEKNRQPIGFKTKGDNRK